jgi:hypothetical protein
MKRVKGSRPPAHLLFTKTQVARTLMLPRRALDRMIEQGILQPVTPEGEKAYFYAADIAGVLSVIEDKVHLSKIWNRVLVAYARSARNERKIDEILSLLGAKEERLPMEEWAIEKLFNKISSCLKKDLRTLSADEVFEWAKTFLAMDHEYLAVVTHFLKTSEPWFQPLLLGQKILDHAPRHLFSDRKDLEVVYGYFMFAFRSFRQESYFHCRTLTGSAKTAGLKFPDIKDNNITREITRLIALGIPDRVPQQLGALKPYARSKKLH